MPISRASQLKNTIADLVRPLNSNRSVNSAGSFLGAWLPKSDEIFDQNTVMIRSYGGARSSSYVDDSKFRFSHQRALQQQNFPAPPSPLITPEWTPSRAQNSARRDETRTRSRRHFKGAQIKAQENHVRGEAVMSPRRAKCSSTEGASDAAATDGSLAASFTDRSTVRNRDVEKNLAGWPVRLLWLAANGPRPPFRERRTVVGER